MKKFLCIFLVVWLPLSMSVAKAMSTQMMLSAQLSSDKQLSSNTSESCHTHIQQYEKSDTCKHCLSCVLAMATATFNDFIVFSTPPKTSTKYLPLESKLVSAQLDSAIKPPILN